MTDLAKNFVDVRSQMEAACSRAGRDTEEVRLVAVSKGHDVAAIQKMYDLGLRDFGESYVQQWQEKVDRLPDDIRWHFVGHLQSNKARFVADRMEMIHSVDRKSVMKELNKRSSDTSNVLLQVNVGDDPNKSGADVEAVSKIARKAVSYEKLRLCGLMTIPPFSDDPDDARQHFVALREQFDQIEAWLRDEHPERAEHFQHLSMGMSADFDIAIEEGATIIRVGTALFGPRSDT